MAKEGMRDVGAKVDTFRTAVARASIHLSPTSVELIRSGKAPKGDPLIVARVAAIQAAKNTPNLLPYCHNVPLDFVGVDFEVRDTEIIAEVEVKAMYRTGVEMEALTAAAAAVLNIFDMMKPIDDNMQISSIELVKKTGGKSDYVGPSHFSAAVIIASDRAHDGAYEDLTGPTLKEALTHQGARVSQMQVVPDDVERIRTAVLNACSNQVNMILIAGGTGVGPRDVTPEALAPLLHRRLEGVEAQLHAYSRLRVPTAMLSRTLVGMRDQTIIMALPGSPSAATDTIRAIFPHIKHSLDVAKGEGHGG